MCQGDVVGAGDAAIDKTDKTTIFLDFTSWWGENVDPGAW